MYYNATLRAGVDLSKAEVKERGDDKIVVKLPHAAIQGTPNIDPNSIEFMDEKKAILNWNKKEDVAEALAKLKRISKPIHLLIQRYCYKELMNMPKN